MREKLSKEDVNFIKEKQVEFIIAMGDYAIEHELPWTAFTKTACDTLPIVLETSLSEFIKTK